MPLPDHISPSQILMYFRCGEQYRRRYVEGEKKPPGIKAICGKAVHYGTEVNYTQKLTTRENLPLATVKAATADGFDASINETGVDLTNEEEGRGLAITLGGAKDAAVAMAEAYHTKIATSIQPLMVEKEITFTTDGVGKKLTGRVDLVTEDEVVCDIKTGARARSETDAQRDLQLTWYSVAYRALTGNRPKAVEFHNINPGKLGAKTSIVRSTRTAQDEEILGNYIQTALIGIARDFFPPANPQSFWCSQKYCGYAKTCKFFTKGVK